LLAVGDAFGLAFDLQLWPEPAKFAASYFSPSLPHRKRMPPF
jgi:hypothetical protein